MLRTGLAVALVASLGANVYLLVTRSSSPTVAPVAPKVVSIDAAVPAVAALPPVAAPPCPPPPPRTDCSAVQRHLDESEQKLASAQPPSTRYKHEPRSPAAEARARKLLAPEFAGLSKSEHPFDVECHGDVCKLDVLDKSIDVNTWMDVVQHSGAFTSWMFSPQGAFATLGSEADTGRNMLMAAISHAIEGDSTILDCVKSKPAGSLTLVIGVDMPTRRLNARTEGSLANEPPGTCVRSHVQAVLDKVAVPDDVTGFTDLSIPLLE